MSTTFRPSTDENELYERSGTGLLSNAIVETGYRMNIIGKESVTKCWSGHIAPAFDVTVPVVDAAFRRSTMPMWYNEPDQKHKKHFEPAPFALPIACYTFFGDSKLHFMSPRSRTKMIGGESLLPQEKADPLQDLRSYIFNKHKPDWKYYTESEFNVANPKESREARVPNVSTRFAMSVRGAYRGESVARYTVDLASSGAYQHALLQARETNIGQNCVIRDPNYPQYTFGDITNPSLRFVVDSVSLDPANPTKRTNAYMFSEDGQTLSKNWQEDQYQFTDKELEARPLLWDPATWNWLSYQEIVDIMLEELHDVPTEFIRAACGHFADVPAERAVKRTAPAAESEREEPQSAASILAKATGGAPPLPAATVTTPPVPTPPVPTPPVPAAATPPVPPVPAPVAPPEMATIAAAGQTPFEVPLSSLPSYRDHFILVNNAWKLVADHISPAPTAAPTPPPAHVVQQPAPVAEQPVDDSAAILDRRRRLLSDDVYAKQTPDVQAACNTAAEQLYRRQLTGATATTEESLFLTDTVSRIVD